MALLELNLSSRETSLQNLEKLPKLSPLLMQFIALVAKPRCEVAELAALIEKDAVLSAQVLERANSAWFGRVQPIRSLQHAIAMLGIGTMRRFALGSSISNLFAREKTAPSFSMARFNLHSVEAGTLVELLAEAIPVPGRASGFIAGLLHDIGTLLIATHMPKRFEEVLAMAAISGEPLLECERQLLGTDHAELSALVISRWDLDDLIQAAAREHHAPPDRVDLTLLVHKADKFVDYLGMSVLPATAPPQEPPTLDFPGVKYPMARVQQRFQAEWSNLWNLLQ